ncbi:MAG: hypothetical protein KC419_16650, partial [Anaerolineales bacterium]|nr:hypothetical protein [Anaerolineales bacterium]
MPAKQEDDANWRRLQRIISMHEARTTDETAPTPSYTGGLGAIVAPSETVSPAAAAPIQHAIDAAESATPPPLESVWPVQRKSPTSPQLMTTSTSAAQMSTPPEPELPPAAPPDPATAETVRAKLNDVSAARRTDSSVELHLPRRPRPAAIQAKKSPESANEIFWNRLRSTDTQSDNRTVPTEIGPLPADMWEILGEVPPVQPEGQVPAMPKMSDTASPPTPTAIQRAAAAAEASPKMPTQTPPARTDPPTDVSTAPLVPPAAVQRAVTAAELPSEASTQTAPTRTDSPTAVSPTLLSTPVAVQRAIAAVEAASELPTQAESIQADSPTAVSATPPLASAAAQQAEISPVLSAQAPSVDSQTAVSSTSLAPPAAAQPAAVEAAPEMSTQTTSTRTDLQTTISPTSPALPTAIQRAVVAAETAPKAPTQTIPTRTEPQTAVLPTAPAAAQRTEIYPTMPTRASLAESPTAVSSTLLVPSVAVQ